MIVRWRWWSIPEFSPLERYASIRGVAARHPQIAIKAHLIFLVPSYNARCHDPLYGALGGGNRTFTNKQDLGNLHNQTEDPQEHHYTCKIVESNFLLWNPNLHILHQNIKVSRRLKHYGSPRNTTVMWLCAESHGQVQQDMLSVVLVLLFQEIYHYNKIFLLFCNSSFFF
jgi:hypothetical protein